MAAFYNELDAFPAAWLTNLIERGHLPPGHVDTRSVVDIEPDDLEGFEQAHFFAGLGGWPFALRLAGIPVDARLWTGSCPCQPFSAAGKRRTHRDERHLWPAWFRLIRERRPIAVFGEQVADGAGIEWLEAVQADLEAEGYTFGAAVLPAAGVGAPHGRHRTFFGAYHDLQRCREIATARLRGESAHGFDAERRRGSGGSADALCGRGPADPGPARGDEAGDEGRPAGGVHIAAGDGPPVVRDEPERERLEGHPGHGDGGRGPGWLDPVTARSASEAGATRGFWGGCDWWHGRDGKYRPAGPGVFPLAHGVPARMGRLRAYGNAIVPEAAAAFMTAFFDTVEATCSQP